MLAPILTFLESKPLLRDLSIIAICGLTYVKVTGIGKTVDEYGKNQNAYAFEVINQSMANVSTPQEAIKLAEKWEARGWSAQLAATKVLCECDGKGGLTSLLGNQGAIDLCRVVR